MSQKVFSEIKTRLAAVALFGALLTITLVSSCAKRVNYDVIKTDNKTIMKISQKMEDGTITYEDIFESDYGEYEEKTPQTGENLDNLVSKAYYYSVRNNDIDDTMKIDFNEIFKNNKDKLVERILDKKHLRHFIYSSGGKRWFLNSTIVNAPLNYFQQRLISMVDKSTLEEISILLWKNIVENKTTFTLNFGTFWVLYGNGYKLDTLFKMMHEYVLSCEQKMKAGQKLTKQDYRIVGEIARLNRFSYVRPGDFTEYIAKKIMMDKIGKTLKCAQNVFNNAQFEK